MGLFKKKNEKNIFNIERTNSIDGLAFDEKDSKLIMLIADGMDWNDGVKHILLLQEKLNNYLHYIASKQYLYEYSNVKSIEIEIEFVFKEPEICRKFITQARNVITSSYENVSLKITFGNKEN